MDETPLRAPHLIDLGEGAWVTYQSNWLSPEESADLFAHLLTAVSWESRPIVVFGKEIPQPRLIGWAGYLPYRYSGQTLEPRPFTEPLQALTERVGAAVGVPFNHLLLNRYRSGQDKLGLHADNEPELGKDPTIAALSVGATRRFQLVRKGKKKKEKKDLLLRDGSLLVMGGTTQHRWYHGVPAQPQVEGERINLTFRLLLGPPGFRSLGPVDDPPAP